MTPLHVSHTCRILKPIRTPGAVQGFGVMIVVAEDVFTETLAVRQVSEVPFQN